MHKSDSDDKSWLDILFLPLHRRIDSGWGGEFVPPVNLGLSVASVSIRFTAVTGVIDEKSRSVLEGTGSNVFSILKNDSYGDRKNNALHDVKFYYKIFLKGRRFLKPDTIVHHAFPLGYGAGFNPLFLSGIKNPKVIGPLCFTPDPLIELSNVKKQGLAADERLGNGRYLLRLLYAKTIESANLILFDSNQTRQQVMDLVPNSADKEFLIMPSCGVSVLENDTKLKFPNDDQGNIRIGIITHLRPRKRVDTVLKALKNCRSELLTLDIIGDGPSRAYLETMVKAFNLGKKVRFLGMVNYFDLKKYLETFDIVIHLDQIPHMINPTIQDTLSAGIPVIFSEESSVAKYKEHQYGWQVDMDDPDPLSDLLNFLTNHTGVIKEKSMKALEYAKSNLSYKSVGTNLANAYLKLAK